MPTLTIPNVPPDLLARLREQAARANRSVEDEVLTQLRERAAPPAALDGLDYIPSPEISAPFDPELPGPAERIIPRNVGAPRLEFWFDEDKVAE